MITLALGAVLLVVSTSNYFFSKGYQSANQAHEAERSYRDTYELRQQECDRIAFPLAKALKCYRSIPTGSREAERAEQDLNAQREMADWSEGMLWTTIIGTLVGTVGLFFLAMTLHETQRTTAAALDGAKQAKIAANAAVDAARTAAGALALERALRRPFLQLTDTKAGMPPSGSRSFGISLSAKIINRGGSPAYLKEAIFSAVFSWIKKETIDIERGSAPPQFLFVSPDGMLGFDAPLAWIDISEDQFKNVTQSGAELTITGSISYCDIGGTSYETGFGYTLIPEMVDGEWVGVFGKTRDPTHWWDSRIPRDDRAT